MNHAFGFFVRPFFYVYTVAVNFMGRQLIRYALELFLRVKNILIF